MHEEEWSADSDFDHLLVGWKWNLGKRQTENQWGGLTTTLIHSVIKGYVKI